MIILIQNKKVYKINKESHGHSDGTDTRTLHPLIQLYSVLFSGKMLIESRGLSESIEERTDTHHSRCEREKESPNVLRPACGASCEVGEAARKRARSWVLCCWSVLSLPSERERENRRYIISATLPFKKSALYGGTGHLSRCGLHSTLFYCVGPHRRVHGNEMHPRRTWTFCVCVCVCVSWIIPILISLAWQSLSFSPSFTR